MSRPLIVLPLVVALSACAALARAPTCDGRHRRPANPHGTVLPVSTAAAPDPLSFRPCGARA